MWKRNCPKCHKEIVYKNIISYKNACKNNTKCIQCTRLNNMKRSADLSILLKDTPESFYWIGFLLADGSFCDNRLRIVVSIKDRDHIKKLGNYIQFKGKYYQNDISFGLSCKDINIVPKICKKFDIKSNKTYNPPNTLLNFNHELLICLLAGFIDGDGNIQHQNKRRDFLLRIKNHGSWHNILEELGSIITDKNCVKINNEGFAQLSITNTSILQNLKKRILTYNLPLLSRKWDIIDLNFVSKYTIAENLRKRVIDLYKNGYKNKDISVMCNTSPANITKIIKKFNNDN